MDTHYFIFISFQMYVNMQKKKTFHFINLTIEDTWEQKYFIVHQYSTIKDGIKKSCDKQQNHKLLKLCGAGGHQTLMDI